MACQDNLCSLVSHEMKSLANKGPGNQFLHNQLLQASAYVSVQKLGLLLSVSFHKAQNPVPVQLMHRITCLNRSRLPKISMYPMYVVMSTFSSQSWEMLVSRTTEGTSLGYFHSFPILLRRTCTLFSIPACNGVCLFVQPGF